MGRIWRVFQLFLFILPSARPAQACEPKTAAEILRDIPALEKQAAAFIDAKRVSAISIAIMKDGHLLYARGFGDGIGTESQFEAASLSKPVSAFTFLELAQKGILPLNAPLTHYVKHPYLPPGEWNDLVTMKTVLSHTSGMGNDVTGVDRKIYFRPGTQFSYSGGGFLYLQQAAEDVIGKGFTEIMAPVLARLGMSHSTFDLHAEGTIESSAAYSLVTTPTDYLMFLDAIAFPKAENRWVSDRMTTPVVDAGAGLQWGLGIGLHASACGLAIRHSGSNFNFHKSFAVMFRPERTGAVVMARGPGSLGVPQELVKEAIGGDFGPE